jgi:hypothetical protein
VNGDGYADLSMYVRTTQLSTRWLAVNLIMSAPNEAPVHMMYIAERPAHADDKRTQITVDVKGLVKAMSEQG